MLLTVRNQREEVVCLGLLLAVDESVFCLMSRLSQQDDICGTEASACRFIRLRDEFKSGLSLNLRKNKEYHKTVFCSKC